MKADKELRRERKLKCFLSARWQRFLSDELTGDALLEACKRLDQFNAGDIDVVKQGELRLPSSIKAAEIRNRGFRKLNVINQMKNACDNLYAFNTSDKFLDLHEAEAGLFKEVLINFYLSLMVNYEKRLKDASLPKVFDKERNER